MLKGYQLMKDRAKTQTRLILSKGMVELSESSEASLPTLNSVKRTIRRHKCLDEDTSINQASVSDLLIPDKYMITLKGELFLMFDSGIGDSNRMLIFSTMKMLSILQHPIIGLQMGPLKLFQSNSSNFTQFMRKKVL